MWWPLRSLWWSMLPALPMVAARIGIPRGGGGSWSWSWSWSWSTQKKKFPPTLLSSTSNSCRSSARSALCVCCDVCVCVCVFCVSVFFFWGGGVCGSVQYEAHEVMKAAQPTRPADLVKHVGCFFFFPLLLRKTLWWWKKLLEKKKIPAYPPYVAQCGLRSQRGVIMTVCMIQP